MKTILVMATTLDGKIGKDVDHPVDWTPREDKSIFVKLTKNAGVVVMGSKTFDTIGRALPGRKNIVMTRNRNRISDDDDLLFTDTPPSQILKKLSMQGFETVALIGGAQINSLFLKEKLINEIYITIVPRLFGDGLSLFNERNDVMLDLISIKKLKKGCLLLRYSVNYEHT